MDVFALAAKLTLDSGDFERGLQSSESRFSSFGGTIKKIAGGLAIGAAVKKTTEAVVSLTKAAVSAYADYEQLVGGVETLFKNSASTVQKYADQAYMTAGVSANRYMETVTSFSASLLQSLGGNTERAAEVANRAMVDMADNANKMGTDMAAIQNAYQGFAKQNYTMLDNLKLGYGGTKTEMQRLLKDAQKLTKVKYDINNLADVYEAIHVIQTEIGITGTTAEEAEKTISGSINMTKAAWENFKVSLARGNVSEAVSRLIYSAKTAAKNVVPVVREVTKNIGVAMQEFAPVISQELPGLIKDLMPGLVGAGGALIEGVIQSLPAIWEGAKQVVSSGIDSITTAIHESYPGLSKAWDGLIQLGKDAVGAAEEAITNIDYILSADSFGEGVGRAIGLVSDMFADNPLSLTFGGFKPEIADVITREQFMKDRLNPEYNPVEFSEDLPDPMDALKEFNRKNSVGKFLTTEEGRSALERLAMESDAISDELKQHAQANGDYSYIISLLYKAEGAEEIDKQLQKIIDAEAASPYDVNVEADMTGNAPVELGLTISKEKAARKALEEYASYLAMQDFSTDANFNDYTTEKAKEVVGALASLYGMTTLQYLSTSEHADNATPELDKIRERLQQELEWDEANGTLKTKSEHSSFGALLSVALIRSALDEYKKTWGDKEVNSSASLDSSGVTDGIDAAEKAQDEYKTAYDGTTIAKPKTEIDNKIPGALAQTETKMGDFTSVWDKKNLATTSSKHDDGTSGPIEEALKAIGDLRGENGKTISTTYSKHYHEIITIAAKAYAEETGKSGEAGQIAQLMASQGLTEDEIEEMLRNGGGGTYKPEKYATAMSGGHILRGATMFGLDSTGRPMVGGEAGPEAIVGVNSLQGMIKQSIREMLGGFPTAQEIAAAMANVRLQVVTDTGALVGEIAGEMDRELSRRTAWRGGGRA